MDMHCIKELGVIHEEAQAALERAVRAHVAGAGVEPSQVYRVREQDKVINPDLRQSQFCAVKDAGVFALAEAVVAALNEKDADVAYSLVRNDVTYIRYEEGGYFKAHEDYLSLTSNTIQEYTLLLCVGGDSGAKGGETVFTVNPYFRISSHESTTPGHALLFRKDIVHEGSVLREGGHKEILTLNLWGVLKKNANILVVTFADSPGVSYEIPQAQIGRIGNIFQGAVRWQGAQRKMKKVEGAFLQQNGGDGRLDSSL